MIETKHKLLDVAERLFGEQGYAATSLRQIIGEAGANLASVHYHFGSKDELLHEVIDRKVGPVNERRLASLTHFEQLAGAEPPGVEQVLEAFLLPMFEMRECHPEFVRVMGRMYMEGLMTMIVQRHFQEVARRFREAFARAVPHLQSDELEWRLHFMLGTMGYCMSGAPAKGVLGHPQISDIPTLVRRMVAFLGAGFRAPAIQQGGEVK